MVAVITSKTVPVAVGGASFLFLFLRFPVAILPTAALLVIGGAVVCGFWGATIRHRAAVELRLRAWLAAFMPALLGFFGIGSLLFAVDAWDSARGLGLPAATISACVVDLVEDASPLPGDRWTAEGRLLTTHTATIECVARGRITIFGSGSIQGLAAGARVKLTGNIVISDSGSPLFFANSYTEVLWLLPMLSVRASFIDLLMERFNRTSTDVASFLSALVLGRKTDFGSPILRDFAASGCMHLLALSGFHVGILATLVRFLFRPIAGVKLSRVISLLVVAIYLILAGLRPSLIRAALMYTFWIRDKQRGYRLPAVQYLAMAFLCQIVLFPRQADELSFLLSYTALAGILIGGLVWSQLLYRFLPRSLSAVFGVGFGAQAATMPMVVRVFTVWRPIALLAAVCLTPPVVVIMIGGLILPALPDGRVSHIVAAFLELVTALIAWIANLFAQVPAVSPSPLASWLILAIGVILPAILARGLRNGQKCDDQPRLPSLNTKLPEFSEYRPQEAMGTEFSDQSRRSPEDYRSIRAQQPKRGLGNRSGTRCHEREHPRRWSGSDGVRDRPGLLPMAGRILRAFGHKNHSRRYH